MGNFLFEFRKFVFGGFFDVQDDLEFLLELEVDFFPLLDAVQEVLEFLSIAQSVGCKVEIGQFIFQVEYFLLVLGI